MVKTRILRCVNNNRAYMTVLLERDDVKMAPLGSSDIGNSSQNITQ